MEYKVRFTWDEEAKVWVAESDDIPGLVLESGSIDALIERVRFAAPELLALNSAQPAASLHFQIDRLERLYA
jgi:predicted RNase H-like HicB family nuclease